jgi:hypothetical protein
MLLPYPTKSPLGKTIQLKHSTPVPETRSTTPSSVHATPDLLRFASVSGTGVQCFESTSAMTKSIAIAVLTQLICRTSAASDVAWDVHIMPVDLRGDASPLVSTTLLCPRRSRAGYAECPRYWQRSCPRPESVRGRGLAAYRQCPRTVRDLVQSMSSDSPRTRNGHGQGADVDSPEPGSVHELGPSMSTISPRPCSVHRLQVSVYNSCPRP